MPDEIAILGATGFVGRALVERLGAQGRSLRLFGRGGGSVVGRPVEPLEALKARLFGVDAVINAAGAPAADRSEAEMRAANIDLPLRAFQAAGQAGVRRFVHISSLHVHGKSAAGTVGPDTPLAPDTLYARTKAEAESRLAALAHDGGPELVLLRPSMIHGPGVGGGFAALAGAVRRGLPLPLGAATAPRSFCQIDNLASAVGLALDASRTGVLIPADRDDGSARALVEAMGRAVGRPTLLLPVPPAPLAMGLRLVGKEEMAASLFGRLAVDRGHWRDWGWIPPLDFDQGVSETLGVRSRKTSDAEPNPAFRD